MGKILACLAALFLTGCGYKAGYGGLSDRYTTISVPYISGDTDGQITSAVIKQISQSGVFVYQECGGDLVLKINILDFRDKNIGFRYDRDKRGKLTRSIIPTETRIILEVDLRLLENCSGREVLGPVIMKTHVDFDHDYYSSRDEINVFSLGQLNDYDAAYDDVIRPLSKALAQKVVDFISNSW